MADEILVVVHPGSADMNLGKMEGRAARDALAYELDHWDGPMVVIHGELSDELPSYPLLHQALNDALGRARQQGHVADEVQGDDNSDHNQVEAIHQWATEHAGTDRPTFRVTGAWYHPEDGGGCVGSVLDELHYLGHQAEVADSAVELLFEGDGEEFDEENETVSQETQRWADRLEARLIQAKTAGFQGLGGECFAGALVIADVLFPDQEVAFTGFFNEALHAKGHAVGHVGVCVPDTEEYLDADGAPKSRENMAVWGMLDPDNLDYQELAKTLGVAWDDEAATEVKEVPLTRSEVEAMCASDDLSRVRAQWGFPPVPPPKPTRRRRLH